MGSDYVSVGEIKIRGRAAKIVLDPNSGAPVFFFCFVSDLKSLLDGEFHYVRVYQDEL